MNLHEIQRRHRWGAILVYERRHYRRTHLPRYLVELNGHAIGDFRTLRAAVKFAYEHPRGGGPELDVWTGQPKGQT